MKPNRIAIYCDESSSFGEIYHFALALALDDMWTGVLIGTPCDRRLRIFRNFLRLFAEEKRLEVVASDQPRNWQHRGKSTEIFLNKWSEGNRRRIRRVIREKGKDHVPLVLSYLNEKGIEPIKKPRLLIWIRNRSDYQSSRNSTECSTNQLVSTARQLDMQPIIVGHPVGRFTPAPENLVGFHNDDCFTRSDDSILLQLLMFQQLREEYGVVASVGMKSGGMDGPALFLGIHTIQFAPRRNSGRIEEIQKRIGTFHVIHLEDRVHNFETYTEKELGTFRAKLREIPRLRGARGMGCQV